jgi:hypothetical protein
LCQETATKAILDGRRSSETNRKSVPASSGSASSSKKANRESVAAGSASLRQEDETIRDQEMFSRWERKVFDMNPDIVASGILLGPGMAEGGAFKKRRDAFTMLIALEHKVADSMPELEELGPDILGRRMKLTMSQLQFVEQVCLVPPSFHVVMYSSCSCDTTRLRMLPDHAEDHT